MNLLLECFVIFWRPVVVLGFGTKLALLVSQMGSNGVDLHEWAEHGVGLPVYVVHTHNCKEEESQVTSLYTYHYSSKNTSILV